jgi:Acetyltransferase (GNAT) domain
MQKTTAETLLAINRTDIERWRALVSTSTAPDIYYLPEYAQATAEIEHSEPVAIIGGSHSCRVLAPLLVRRMSAVVNGSTLDWTDACSPYGYGGLLKLSGNEQIDTRNLRYFFEDLQNWCSDHHLVCCVLRLHPLLRQEEWFMPEEPWQNILNVERRGSTTAIALDNWDTALDQPKGMRRDRRADLRLARSALRVTWASGEDHDIRANLGLFFEIYKRALDRHRADDFFRFSSDYFYHLAALGPRLGIAFAWLDDQLVGANLFLGGWDFAHGHLAGIDDIGLKHGTATLLIVEGAKWATQLGCKLLHLGGGLNPGDSLEDYKRSFGGPSFRYAYLRYIADAERFQQLCQIPNAPWPYKVNET